MAYKTISLPVAGPSYKDRSRPVSPQSSVNMYPSGSNQTTPKIIIRSWPGLAVFGTPPTAGIDRGMIVFDGFVYRVVSNTLYRVAISGTHTEIGGIPGTARCSLAHDPLNLFICDGQGGVWKYDRASLTQVTDANINGSTFVTFLNNQLIYTNNPLFVVSQPGDGGTANALDAAGAESQPDALIRASAFDEKLFLFGAETVEQWYNSGTGNPPFSRITGSILNVGLGAPHAVTTTKQSLYFLGSDKAIYRERGGQAELMTPPAISDEIAGYADVSDCFAASIFYDGQDFVVFSFPTANRTWALNTALGQDGWFELSSGGPAIDAPAYQGGSVVSHYNKILIADVNDGRLLSLSKDAFDSAGASRICRRVTAPLRGIEVGFPGQRLRMNRAEFIFEKGATPVLSGQGEDPKLMVEVSFDGGKSFNFSSWVRMGRLGETQLKAEYWKTISFHEIVFRITVSDPVDLTLYGASIDITSAGRR